MKYSDHRCWSYFDPWELMFLMVTIGFAAPPENQAITKAEKNNFKNDGKAFNTIVSALTDGEYMRVVDCTTAKAM